LDVCDLRTELIKYSKNFIKDEIFKQFVNFSFYANAYFQKRSNETDKNNGFGVNAEEKEINSAKIKQKA